MHHVLVFTVNDTLAYNNVPVKIVTVKPDYNYRETYAIIITV